MNYIPAGSGPIDIVCNVGITLYGWDVSAVSCGIDVSATLIIQKHIQKFGRVLRPFPAPSGPRPYQDRIFRQTSEALDRGRDPLIVSPTGSGKSHIVMLIAAAAVANGYRIGYMIDRRDLVDDLARRFSGTGMDFGVVMAGHPRWNPAAPIQIASVDTMFSRGHVLDVDAIIIDEARKSLSPKWDEAIAAHPGVRLIGMDATPIPGLTRRFDDVVTGPSTSELIRCGFLSPYRAFSLPAPDLSQVPKTNGDYSGAAVGEIMGERKIVGDVVSTWMNHAAGRRTVLFAPSKDCSRRYRDMFAAAGVQAAHVDASTPSELRQEVWARLALNAPPKHDALWLDHVGNCISLDCTPSDIESWSLEDGKPKRVSADDASLSAINFSGVQLAGTSRAFVDGDVTGEAFGARAVDHGSAANDEVVHGILPYSDAEDIAAPRRKGSVFGGSPIRLR